MFDKDKNNQTRLIFVTSGILLAYIRYRKDGLLRRYSVIVLDEVHEMSSEMIVLLLYLRKVVMKRKAMWEAGRGPRLRIVLMSASLDTETFRSYFTKHNQMYAINGHL